LQIATFSLKQTSAHRQQQLYFPPLSIIQIRVRLLYVIDWFPVGQEVENTLDKSWTRIEEEKRNKYKSAQNGIWLAKSVPMCFSVVLINTIT